MVDLSGTGQSAVCYAAAHTAVVYDTASKKQRVLQGHCNPITALVATKDKSVVVTADAGPDSMVVLWNAATGEPVRTINTPHAGGVVALDISPEGTHLVTLGAEGPEPVQEIIVWDLEKTTDAVAAVGQVPAGDWQTSVKFNPDAPSELVTNGAQKVYLWEMSASGDFKSYSPPISARDFKQAIGTFTQSIFLPGGVRAVTGTMDGDIIVWEEVRMPETAARASDRRATKILRLHHAAITALSTVEQYVVTGSADGFVRFFDPKLRLTAWFDELASGAVTSISFSAEPSELLGTLDPAEEHDHFMAPNFVVGTATSRVLSVRSASFEMYDSTERKGELVLEGTYGAVRAIAAHPSVSEVAVVGDAGKVWLWDYEKHALVAVRPLDGMAGTVLCYSSDETMLAVGFTNGTLKLLSARGLEDVQTMKFTAAAITKVAFSEDGLYAATADAEGCVALVGYGMGKQGNKWECVGKYRSHSAPVSGLAFWGRGAGVQLFSSGEDARLVEYDVKGSSKLRAVSATGASVPTAMALLGSGSADDLTVMTADAAFKVREYDAATLTPKSTVLGPTYGGPLSQFTLFQPFGSAKKYLAYSTPDKVVGLCAFPLTGDPNKAMGLIAHPGEVSCIAMARDGKRMFTAGGADGIVNCWAVDIGALDAAVAGDASPFDALIEGGEAGEFYAEIKDYFYYAQISSHGEDSALPRKLDGTVPLTMLPTLLRALGYYPSEADLGDMMTELKGKAAVAGEPEPTSIDFTGFLSLYCNYRPVFGVGKDQIADAFKTLGIDSDSGRLSRDVLLESLLRQGERMSGDEIADCLSLLYGMSDPTEAIPEQVTAKDFAEDILGFESYSPEYETEAY